MSPPKTKVAHLGVGVGEGGIGVGTVLLMIANLATVLVSEEADNLFANQIPDTIPIIETAKIATISFDFTIGSISYCLSSSHA